MESVAGILNLRDYGSVLDNLKLGKFVAIDNVDDDTRTVMAASRLKSHGAASFVHIPILEGGRRAFAQRSFTAA